MFPHPDPGITYSAGKASVCAPIASMSVMEGLEKRVGDLWAAHPLNLTVSMLNTQTCGRPRSISA